MTSPTNRWAERLLAVTIPRTDRQAVLGDLWEESGAAETGGTGRRAGWRLAQLLRIGARFQAEPYRDVATRIGLLWIGAVGAMLLWVVPLAAGDAEPNPALYSDPLSRLGLLLWSRAQWAGALAAGLAVGRMPGLPDHAGQLRHHVGLVLAVLVLATTPWNGAGPTVLMLLGGLWLGDRARAARAAPHVAP